MSRSATGRERWCALALAALTLLTLENAASADQVDPARLLTGKVGGLTAEQVARRATDTSLAAEQKRREVVAAAANLDQALYDFIPRLSGQASYNRLSRVDSGSLGTLVAAPGAEPGPLMPGQPLVAVPLQVDSVQNATSFTASLTLPLSDYVFRLFQSRDAAKAQLQASRLSLEATQRKAAYDARALYYDWVRAELEAAAARQNLELSQEHLVHLHALAAAETASAADVARVEATLAASERVLEQASNLAALQRERISIAMHETSSAPFQIGEDLTTSPVVSAERRDIAALSKRAERLRPELKAVELSALAYEKQADATRSKALPRLEGLAQTTWANPNQRYFPQRNEFHASWQLGLQLSFSLSDTLNATTQIISTRAQAAGAVAQRGQLLDAVRTEVTEAVLSERTARAGLDSSARRLTAAQTSYRARHQRFMVGAATTVELTEAQTELFNAELDAVQARVGIRAAQARLDYVIGEGS